MALTLPAAVAACTVPSVLVRRVGRQALINLCMTHPHAAGALLSTVDDLAKWDAALYREKLVKQESLKKAWTPLVVNDGRPTRYGYGWMITTVEGQRIITHGGSINGFSCEAVRLPDAKVYVAILTNREASVSNLHLKIADAGDPQAGLSRGSS
jgi:CubicO group peptidase (beta-lactamase class C family)